MVKKYLLSYVILSILSFSLLGGNVDQQTAARIAKNFYYESLSQFKDLAVNEISITSSFTREEGGIPVYYVFNINNEGFVMVAAEDNVVPVLGYSFESIWSGDHFPVQLNDWAENYKDQILYHRNHQTQASPEITQAWRHLSTINQAELTTLSGTKSVTPLIISAWDQGAFYNELCPSDALGPGGKVWAGCVATAMAQIMYYYRYPLQGNSSHTYNSSYGNLSANFGATTYRWDEMLNCLTASNIPVATLIYHCGVSVNMGYSPNGSGASSQSAANSLKNYFKYSSSLSYKSKSGYSDANWASLLRTELDAKRPVYYDGYGNQGGHAFNVDGYQGTNYFHFNWGWSGAYNGYFYLTNLNPGGDDFTNGQGAITGIYPGSGYPYYCSGTKTITTLSGTIEDGSGPAAYQAHSNCYYLFAPQVTAYDTVSSITITFNRFDTENLNDLVTVYDGGTITSPVIGSYSGSSLPPTITSTGNKLLIEFSTNATINNDGWLLTYTANQPVFCHGLTTLTAPSGSLGDGSGTKKYMNKSICQWLIKPPNAHLINIHFSSFNTEPVYDFLEVYAFDSLTTTGTLLGRYSGSSIPPDLSSTSGGMFLIFYTNTSNNYQGWSLTYTSSQVGIENNEVLKDLRIYPNPASEILNVSFDPGKASFIETGLFNLTGEAVFNSITKETTALFRQGISLARIAKGVYFLKITTDSGTLTRKVVVQ